MTLTSQKLKGAIGFLLLWVSHLEWEMVSSSNKLLYESTAFKLQGWFCRHPVLLPPGHFIWCGIMTMIHQRSRWDYTPNVCSVWFPQQVPFLMVLEVVL